jgi:hypothetical protein
MFCSHAIREFQIDNRAENALVWPMEIKPFETFIAVCLPVVAAFASDAPNSCLISMLTWQGAASHASISI